MMAREIFRRGTVRQIEDGCATIEVSVPCSTCTQGGCMGRQRPGPLMLQNLSVDAGDPVDIGLTARQLNAACFGLFGPAVTWLLLLAALSGSSVSVWTGPTSGAVIGASGLVIALLVGARLGRNSALLLAQRITVRTLSDRRLPDCLPDHLVDGRQNRIPDSG